MVKHLFSLLVEPERPEYYSQLPRFKDALYWHRMARAVQSVNSDIMEITRYRDRRYRAMGLIVGIFILLVIPTSFIRSAGSFSEWRADFLDSYEYVFHFEEHVRRQYREGFASTRQRSTEDEYVERFKNSYLHDNRFIKEFGFYIFLALMALVPLGLAILTPLYCPLRFDRQREVAYTWEKGELYVADVGPLLGGLKTHLESSMPHSPYTFWGKDKSTGSVVITLHKASDPTQHKDIEIGPYPVTHAHQNIDLTMLIQAFMSRDSYNAQGQREPWKGEWLQQLKPEGYFFRDFLRRQSQWTLGRCYYFDEAKTEQVLMEYLTNPNTRDRGVPIRY